MANAGKYVDRLPEILTAGIPSKINNGIAECLYIPITYNEALNEIPKRIKKPLNYKMKPLINSGYQGLDTEISLILQAPEKTVFQSLLNEFKATQYASYFKAPLGKCRDPNPGLPKPMPEPKPPIPRIHVKDLINPPKTVGQVKFEDEFAHDLYVKSHEDYFPGEKIIRHYKSDNFSVNKRYGYKTHSNWCGVGVSNCLQWCNQANVSAVSSVLADFINKKRSPIGKPLIRYPGLSNKLSECRFGKVIPLNYYGAKELLSEAPPCNLTEIRLEWLTCINQLRQFLKKHHFPYSKFLLTLQCKDVGGGYIDEENLTYLCKKFNISLNLKEIDSLLYHLNIKNDKLYKIFEFWNLINWQCEFPDLGKLEDISPVYQHWETEYNQMTDPEILSKETKDDLTLGNASVSFSTGLPTADVKSNLESLSDETTVRALINPNIYTQYGLSHRDFLLPRKEKEMRKLIESFGWTLPDDVFKELWRIGCEQDAQDKKAEIVDYNNSKCCLETYRNLLDRLINEHLALQQ